jgi:hypothetical protein
MISMRADDAEALANGIHTKLNESDVGELRWRKIKGARERFAASKVMEICLGEAKRGKLRVDVLVWDTRDSRHDVRGRDDAKNLNNMYIQLFKNVLRRRWPTDATWQIFPDENSLLDWDRVRNVLARTDRFDGDGGLLLSEDWQALRDHFKVAEIADVNSTSVHIGQAADVLAGMGVFSYEHLGAHKAWQRENSKQMSLFPESRAHLSSKDEEHSRVLYEFVAMCTKWSLGVELDPHHGLCTKNPSMRVNFWFYRPQRRDDKAPVRVRRPATEAGRGHDVNKL